MHKRPLVIVDNHVEQVNIDIPSPSIITSEALDKLLFAIQRTSNKFHKQLRCIPESWTHAYIEELTPDRCVYIVVYGVGIADPMQDHVKYEVNVNELLNKLTPERIISNE